MTLRPPHRCRQAATSVLAAWAVAAAPAWSQPVVGTSVPQNVLHLSADASAEVVQDLVTIVLAVVREGADAAQVQSQLRQVVEAGLAEARKAVRPGQVEVRTGGFNLSPRYAPGKPGQAPSIAGWQGRAELVLEGRDQAAIGQLAGRLGGLTVQQVAFGLSREAREQAEAEVAARAIARFRSRAERHAQAFGFAGYTLREVTVGGAETSGTGPQPMVRAARMAMAAPMADESQPVEAGKATVSVSVSGSVLLAVR